MIHFDFDERYHDEDVVGTAISRREGVLLSVIFHGLVAAAFIIGPSLPIFQPSPEELQRRQAELERQREEASRRFVFVQPQVDIPALRPPERSELSDLDRQAQDPVIAREPENPLPFSRGDSPERVEAAEPERARGADEPEPPQPEAESELARVLPPADNGTRRAPETTTPRLRGSLGDALKNLQMAKQLADQQKLDGGQCQNCNGMGDYAALYKKLCQGNGMGEGEDGNGAGGMGKNRGQGRGGKAEENDEAETGFKQERSPTQLTAGKTLLQWKTQELGPTGTRSEEYQEAVKQVKQGVSEAIVLEQVPPGYHESIKSYFDSLDPGDK